MSAEPSVTQVLDRQQILRRLPAPYSGLKELLPFRCWGWFHTRSGLIKIFEQVKPIIVVEIGSWLGESASWMARRLPEGGRVFCIDTWEGSVEHRAKPEWAIELPTLYEQFLSNIVAQQLTGKITPIRGRSVDVADTWEDESHIVNFEEWPLRADLIFVDGSHEEEDVLADCRAWWPQLRPGGVMCGDDWAWATVSRAVQRFCTELKLPARIDGDLWAITKPEVPA